MMKGGFRNAVFHDTLRNKAYGISVIFVLPKKIIQPQKVRLIVWNLKYLKSANTKRNLN